MSTDAETVPDVRRSRDGRPYILQPDTGKEVLYTRASTFAKTLSDGAALEAWKMRMAYIGLSKSPGLLGMQERSSIDESIAVAMDLAGANDRANLGTALHGLTEWIDRGDPIGEDFQASAEVWDALDRYVAVTKHLIPVEIERFVVNDQFKVAGTFDRTFSVPSHLVPGRGPAGFTTVPADLKTGATLRLQEHAMQLAMYANSQFYNMADGARSPLDCDREVGLIVHVPYDPTVADTQLVWVDLVEGWQSCQLAAQVRASRSRAARFVKKPSPKAMEREEQK